MPDIPFQEKVRPERPTPPGFPAQDKLRGERPNGGGSAALAAIRRSVVDLARSFVKKGHYLEGTAGNTPNFADGNPGGDKQDACRMLTPNINIDLRETRKQQVISVNTAVQNKFKGFNTCAGRSARFQQPTAAELQKYLVAIQEAALRNPNPASWPGHGPFKLHPRRYFLSDKLQEQGKIVWGESCVGVRHHDCVGLINFCYEEHTSRPGGWGFEIEQYHDSEITGTRIVRMSDAGDGDIAVKLLKNGHPHDHIGLIQLIGGRLKIIQAKETKVGLTDDEDFVPQEWDRVVRVRDEFLVRRKGKLRDGDGR
jgi:hypothetical protein